MHTHDDISRRSVRTMPRNTLLSRGCSFSIATCILLRMPHTNIGRYAAHAALSDVDMHRRHGVRRRGCSPVVHRAPFPTFSLYALLSPRPSRVLPLFIDPQHSALCIPESYYYYMATQTESNRSRSPSQPSSHPAIQPLEAICAAVVPICVPPRRQPSPDGPPTCNHVTAPKETTRMASHFCFLSAWDPLDGPDDSHVGALLCTVPLGERAGRSFLCQKWTGTLVPPLSAAVSDLGDPQ